MTSGKEPDHLIFIVGGAVAGSEAARQFAGRGICCVVIEQKRRPYGKIEDGLPRWHVKLRASEASKIDEKLDHPLVHFVPNTRVGRDVSLAELLDLGPSAIVLANGAWRDRPLPVPGVEAYRGRGFVYQNELVAWFNHYLESDYDGPRLDPPDGALVIGGGLASLDVMKILQLETVVRALRRRGIEADVHDMERRGIKGCLEDLKLSLSELGVRPATLCYRRTVGEMPVVQGSGAGQKDPERLQAVRRKILENCQQKYLFKFEERVVPVGVLSEGGKLTGLLLRQTELRDGRVEEVAGSDRSFMGPLVVSSIGSVPEPIPSVPTRGELYAISDGATGEIEGMHGVFAMGNAVTGKGNISASLKHGRKVSEKMLDEYLSGEAAGYEESWADAVAEAKAKTAAVAGKLEGNRRISGARFKAILDFVRKLQARSGYDGNYKAWVKRGSILHGLLRESLPQSE